MKAFIYFPGDWSVGVPSESLQLQMELPFELMGPEYREETRRDIQKLYTEMSGGENCQVSFSDEKDNDQ